jgi:inorganic pyrophosphatase
MSSRARTPDPRLTVLGQLFKRHPWHGVSPGDELPEVLTCYIEVVPTDTVKYEVDKATGYLMLDRPQLYSSVCPTLYGLVPRTYCAERVAAITAAALGQPVTGDGDPLDVCVLTEQNIPRGDILCRAIPIGGLHVIDGGEADDKIVAVLENDGVYGRVKDIAQIPPVLLDRLKHYFLNYKDGPGVSERSVAIIDVYGREAAHAVIRASREDYQAHFGPLEALQTGDAAG